mgnify:FL=1
MEISIYTSDIRDFDREIERKFDVSEEYGTSIFDDDNRISLDGMKYYIEPFTYIGIIADMQQQINELKEQLNGR